MGAPCPVCALVLRPTDPGCRSALAGQGRPQGCPAAPAEGAPFRRSADVIGPICQRLERFAKDGAALRRNPPDSKRTAIFAPQNCLFTSPCTRARGSEMQAREKGRVKRDHCGGPALQACGRKNVGNTKIYAKFGAAEVSPHALVSATAK